VSVVESCNITQVSSGISPCKGRSCVEPANLVVSTSVACWRMSRARDGGELEAEMSRRFAPGTRGAIAPSQPAPVARPHSQTDRRRLETHRGRPNSSRSGRRARHLSACCAAWRSAARCADESRQARLSATEGQRTRACPRGAAPARTKIMEPSQCLAHVPAGTG
jgi:hypothetical protein